MTDGQTAETTQDPAPSGAQDDEALAAATETGGDATS